MSLEKRTAEWIDLGTTDYEETFKLQEYLAEKRKMGEIGDTILITEHLPLVNFGSANMHNKFSKELIDEVGTPDERKIINYLSEKGVSFNKSERGGGSTYIGPGQLVFYPIVNYENIVNRPLGIGNYKYLIDEIMADSLKQVGIDAQVFKVTENLGEDGDNKRRDRKDVWITENGMYYKLGGKGIHASGAVAYHGFNFYLDDKSTNGFWYIDPCGYTKDELGVKSVGGVLGKDIDRNFFRDIVLGKMKNGFGYDELTQGDIEKIKDKTGYTVIGAN
jgi:lipoate-protein ligase B